MRVWQLDAGAGSLKTWKRVEYGADRVDELVLVKGGLVLVPQSRCEDRSCTVS